MTFSWFLKPQLALLTVDLAVVKLDQHAYAAVDGAAYHLGKIEEAIHRPGMQIMPSTWENDPSIDEATKRGMRDDRNVFFWHIRAFFWELVATFDTMLQWANRKYDLGISESEVKWRRVCREAHKGQSEAGKGQKDQDE